MPLIVAVSALVDAQLGLGAERGKDASRGGRALEVLHDEQLAPRSELAQAEHVGHHRPVQHAARRRVPPLRATRAGTFQLLPLLNLLHIILPLLAGQVMGTVWIIVLHAQWLLSLIDPPGSLFGFPHPCARLLESGMIASILLIFVSAAQS